MNNKEFIAALSQRSGYTQTDTQRLVNSLIDEMANCFGEGEVVSIPSFGSFEVKKRLERVVVNPSSVCACWFPLNLFWDSSPLHRLRNN